MKHRRKSFSYAKYGYLFVLPFTIAFLVFSLYPTLYTLLIGFTDMQGMKQTFTFLKSDIFKNFRDILTQETFRLALGNTFRIWIANFIPQMLLALLLAEWFTNRRSHIRAKGFWKVLFYMPNIITAATIAILFNALFGYPMGPVNDLLMRLHIISKPYYFVQNKTVARDIVIFIQTWMWYGYTMIIMIAGIDGINPEIFEVAEVDGATRFQTFFRITLPNIRTILLFTFVTSLIGGLGMFDIPRLFQNGNPDKATLTTSLHIFNMAFGTSHLYNRAAAASMIMFVIIIAISMVLFFLMRDKDEAELRKQVKAQQKAYKSR